MKITLTKWAEQNFDPPPHISTLRVGARDGKIYPPPLNIGKTYYVADDAMHISEYERGPRLVHRLGLEKFPK